ncbi:hypothetical protein DB347_15005 [Opitutaceae bacterium EW11]|nr:hypothetical protein DB347_15005 [Opitutaceae bacterium EW11]
MNTKSHRVAAAIAALVLAGGCQRDHGAVQSLPKPVNVHVVRAHDVAVEVISSGAIEPIGNADIAFQVPGRVASVDVADGMQVRKGQPLAHLDPTDFQKSFAIAEAQYDEVRARHARLSRLHKAGSLTDTDFDKIEAALKQSGAALDLAQRQLGYTELTAPFDGWVEKRGIEAGVVVTPGVAVFTVRTEGDVWANLGVAEVDISRVQIGQNVEVSVPASGATAHHGVVEAIVPRADILSRAFTVKVRLQNPQGDLRPGTVVVGHILTGQNRSAVTVPPGVVQKDPDGSLFVWSVDPARHVAVRQIVEVGALRASDVEIVSGLKDGDQVVLNVPHTLFEGTSLSIAEKP